MPYSNYSLSDLVEARTSVCQKRYPDAAQQIELAIVDKLAQGEHLPDSHSSRFVGLITLSLLIDTILLIGVIWLALPKDLMHTMFYLIGPLGITYFSLSRGWFSATLGQALTGLKLIDIRSEQKISFTQAIERDLPLWFALVLLTVYLAWSHFFNASLVGAELALVTQLFFIWHTLEWALNCFRPSALSIGDQIAKIKLIKD